MHKSLAWPLIALYVALILYASLYPFGGWNWDGVQSWRFFLEPWPRYWSAFEFAINVAGYAPLGLLMTLALLRGRFARFAPWLAVPIGSALSAMMEATQSHLPMRVPSNVDWALNTLGVMLGALIAVLAARWGWLQRWGRWRTAWLVPNARMPTVLVLLWPGALLFPNPLPLATGQVLERVERVLAEALHGSPMKDWLPLRSVELEPALPLAQLAGVALGLLLPCLLAFDVLRRPAQRMVATGALLAVGVAVTALSAALTWGPQHAWAWSTPQVLLGLGLGGLAALVLAWVPGPQRLVLSVLALGVYVTLINEMPASGYLADNLETWEQGRFIQFHGLAQWLGWLWPYAVLLQRLAQPVGRAEVARKN